MTSSIYFDDSLAYDSPATEKYYSKTIDLDSVGAGNIGSSGIPDMYHDIIPNENQKIYVSEDKKYFPMNYVC